MLLDLTVSQSIVINAPTTKVWEALTNPKIIALYLYGTETITDWKVGSPIIFQGEYEGQHYQDKGVVTENVFLQKIVYKYWSGFSGLEDLPENYNLVAYHLENNDNQTTNFTWSQTGYSTQEGYEHSLGGMHAFLETIKKVVEEMPTLDATKMPKAKFELAPLLHQLEVGKSFFIAKTEWVSKKTVGAKIYRLMKENRKNYVVKSAVDKSGWTVERIS
jgi:uncharacterized protein YndB with AHSA1/START domain